jgi:hypothetical protein
MAVPDALVVAERDPQPFGVAQESAHVTPLLAESPVTVAVKVVVAFTTTVAAVCEREIETPAGVPGVIVIVAEADFTLSAIEVAVSVTIAGFGTTTGAV